MTGYICSLKKHILLLFDKIIFKSSSLYGYFTHCT